MFCDSDIAIEFWHDLVAISSPQSGHRLEERRGPTLGREKASEMK
jgi:hypothetical protein